MAYLGAQPSRGQWRKLSDISSGFNGSTTSFTLSVPPGSSQYYVTPGSASQLLISLGGVIQQPDVDYTVNTNTITFTTAPAAGLSFFGVLCGDALNAGTPADGSVTDAKLASLTTVNVTNLKNPSSASNNIVLDSSGRVGIGTSSPSSLLHVGGVATPTVSATPTSIRLDNTFTGSPAAGNKLKFYLYNDGSEYYGLTVGDAADFQYWAGGGSAGTHRWFTSNTERMRIDSSGRVLVGTTVARASSLTEFVNGSANTNADYSGAAASFVAPGLVGTNTNSATISVEDNRAMAADVGGSIGFGGRYLTSNTSYAQWAAIAGKKENGTSGEYGGYLGLYTRTHASANIVERMRVNSAGALLVGTTTHRNTTRFVVDADGTNAGATFYQPSTASYTAIFLNNPNGNVGSIVTNGGGTAYNTSSDYRLKENIEPVADGITRLKQLNPSRFNFITDPDRTVDGFIAHEVQAVVPEAITGEKDAVDDDGNPIYQGIDQSKLVPLLTAALQEAIAKIETLEAKVDALETA